MSEERAAGDGSEAKREEAELEDLDPGEDSEEVRGGATRRPEPQPPPSGPVPMPYPNT